MRIISIIILVLFLTISCSNEKGIFVSVNGDDSNNGSKLQPVASLQKAIKLLENNKNENLIYLRQGTYKIDSTIYISNLANITIKPYNNEKVILIGAEKISGFKPIHKNIANYDKICDSISNKIYYCDLKSLGITKYGNIKPRGFGKAVMPSGLMLYFNEKQMTIARWPNKRWTKINDIPQELNGKGFTYTELQPEKWTNIQDVWMHGYWKWNWADAYVKIESIDTVKKQIKVADPQSPYPYSKKRRYYYFNILEELDSPGEWYLDCKNGIIYFYPPSKIDSNTEMYVSILDSFMIVINNSKNILIENIGFKYSNNGAIKIVNGSDNLIKNCVFKNLNTLAVSIGEIKLGRSSYKTNKYFSNAGNNNGIYSCEISNCGEGGVLLGGGDRKTLSAGNNFVENCKIYKTSQWVKTYRPAIHIFGVGNKVKNNEIYDLPHSAILYKGNDHIIEYNNIYKVCTKTVDAGAIYTGRDWTQCGHIIRYNYIHDLQGNIAKTETEFNDVMGVYLDDFTSGVSVFGNIFYNAGRSVLIGGGRNNSIKNNIFINGNPALHIDARGIGWAKKYFTAEDPVLFKRFRAVNADKPPYSEKYPFLKNLLNDEPDMPKYNCIENNIFCKGEWIEFLDNLNDSIICFNNNIVDTNDCNFYKIKDNSIEINFHSKLFNSDFDKIPVDSIGVITN